MSDLQTVPAELDQEIARTGLARESVLILRNAYGPHFADFLAVEETANAVPQNAPDLARAVRLKLKNIRVAAEHTRKALKEDSLRRGQAIDGVNRLLLARLAPLEERMRDIEEREARERQARIDALQAARAEQIALYQAYCQVTDLATLSEEQFAGLLARCKDAHENAVAEAAAAEAERVAREAEREAERERLREENRRLAAEKAEADAKTAEERRAKQAAEREVARREAADQQAAEAARRAEEARLAAERAAAAAPDAEKLRAFAETVRALPIPECDTEAGCAIVDEIGNQTERFARWVEAKAKALEG